MCCISNLSCMLLSLKDVILPSNEFSIKSFLENRTSSKELLQFVKLTVFLPDFEYHMFKVKVFCAAFKLVSSC